MIIFELLNAHIVLKKKKEKEKEKDKRKEKKSILLNSIKC